MNTNPLIHSATGKSSAPKSPEIDPSSRVPLGKTSFSRTLSLLTLICLLVSNARGSTGLVIAEVYGGGGNSGSTYKNDFIVIFNPTGSSIDVNGWSVQYASASGTSWSVTPLASTSKTIAAGGYFLVQEAVGAGGTTSLPTPDAIGTIAMSASAGKVALCNSTNALTGSCPTGGSVIDFVGYGTGGSGANCFETAATPTLSATASAQRKDSGCTDNDNNSLDFALGAPNPRNSISPIHSCGAGGGPLGIASQPVSATNGANSTAIFTVSASGAGPYSYQWQKVGIGVLTDGGNISGATTATLTLSKVVKADEGNYFVTISNPVPESTNSVTVQLTVLDPVINTQPVSRTNLTGDIADIFVTAYGSGPMNYQWYKNGNPVSIGTYTFNSPTNTFSANLTNVQPADAGNYYLVASNSFGAVTSSVVSAVVFPTPSVRIARWNFNNNSLTPSEGAGTMTLLATNSASFATGSFSDPGQIDAPLLNKGFGTTGYPGSLADNKTGGVQFSGLSTVGYQDIMVAWEQRHSNTASKYLRLQYSSNGVDFVDFTVLTMSDTNNNFVFFSSDLAGIPTLNNNPNFAFRIVSEFQFTATGAGTNDYVGTVGNYGVGGTVRYDLMSIYGNPLGTVTPIPLSIQLLGTDAVLSWSNPSFSLQAAPAVDGTYTNIPGAVSPYTNAASSAQKYFRLKY